MILLAIPLLWVCLILTGPFGQVIVVVWVAIGIFFVMNSRSSGFWVDALFVLTWPINAYLDWRGR